MIPTPYLNICMPHKWAQVVSGETWAEYAVGPSGSVEVRTTRGPLILWATKIGDEAHPHLDYVARLVAVLPDVPMPSQLEVQAARLNMRPRFLAFVRAARGKVRASVRWKTGHRAGKVRVLWSLRAVFLAQEATRQVHRLGRELRRLRLRLRSRIYRRNVKDHLERRSGTIKARVNLVRLKKDQTKMVFSSFVLKKPSSFFAVAAAKFVDSLARLEAVLLNRGAKNRVKWAALAQRVRVPRPLYARSRPPTAPLAPPVA